MYHDVPRCTGVDFSLLKIYSKFVAKVDQQWDFGVNYLAAATKIRSQ